MPEGKKTEVVIDGRNFTVVGGDNEDYINELAYYVDKNIRKLTSKNEKLSQPMAAILAALNIADQYYKTRDKLSELEEKARDPLEKYDEVCHELDRTKEKIEDIETRNQELINAEKDWEAREAGLVEEIKKLKGNNQSLKDKVEEYQRELKSLQDKNFKSQVELVEVKKELGEYMSLLDSETSSIGKKE